MANMNLKKDVVRQLADEMRAYKKNFESSIAQSKDALLTLGTTFQDDRYNDFKKSYSNIEENMNELVKNLDKAANRLDYIYSILPK